MKNSSRRHVTAPDGFGLVRLWFTLLILVSTVLSPLSYGMQPPGSFYQKPSGGDQERPSLISAALPDLPSEASPALPSTGSPLQSTYVSDQPLQDGTRQLTISSTPIQYQAEDGSWQPVEARFQKVQNGFTNFTNALKISSGERVATLNLRSGDIRLQWEPLELSLTTAGEKPVSLASVLDPLQAAPGHLVGESRTVRYPSSWSIPEIVEEITSGPGQVEQKLVVESPPLVSSEAVSEASLSLVARLRLQPGVTLFSGDAVQVGAFHSTGPVEIRSEGQTVLVFDPVLAYEQNDPSRQITGSYRFTPTGQDEWQVEVQTPWSWWASAERNYPVVLDPTMKMLSPITTAQLCDKYAYTPCPATGSKDPETGAQVLYIGTTNLWGIVEALIRFDNLPSLPPGYVVQKADLLVAPYNHILGNGGSYIGRQTRLYQVTSAWDPSTVANHYTKRPTINPSYLDQKTLHEGIKPAIPVKATAFVTRYHLQNGPAGMVTDWISGVGNNGVLLAQYPANLCTICQDVSVIPTNPFWVKDDIRRLDPGNPYLVSASESSGIMLQITYAPPTLSTGQIISSQLPTFGEIYADTYHAYRPPNSSSTWTAIAVKGVKQTLQDGQTIEQAAGNLRLGRGCTDPFNSACAPKVSEGDFKGKPNFILARGDPTATDLQAWVYPPNPAAPANASLSQYKIAAVASSNLQGNPTLSPGAHITRTVVMSTDEILQVVNLNLAANSRIGVRVHATALDPVSGYPVDMPYFDVRLYKPSTSGTTLVKDLDGQYLGGHNAPGVFEMGKAKVGLADGGAWALVLEYFGDPDPSLGEPPVPYTSPVSMSVEIVLVSCAINAIPTSDGCFTVTHPGPATPYMDVGNFRVFNQAGFFCPTATCSTILQPGPGATLPAIVWKDNWIAGQQDRWVAVADYPVVFNTTTTPMYFSTLGNTWLAYDSSGIELLEIASGSTVGYPDVYNTSDPNYARLVPIGTAVYASPPLSASDTESLLMKINVRQQRAEATTTLNRQVETLPGNLETFTFQLSWTVRAEGYGASLANKTLHLISLPPFAQVASLKLIFGSDWEMDYTDAFLPNGRFTNLRGLPGAYGDGGAGARIAAPSSLGSNWKGVTALLLPVGVDLPDSSGACPGDCLDIRASSDTLAVPNRVWDLPDLNISGQAQTLYFNKPGELTVFSTDHPNSVQELDLPFSFRTFKGKVNVDVKVCPGSGSPDKVVVITGESKIALPGLGSDTNPGTSIDAAFILCETALREVALSFTGPPDIPVGSTGIFVDYIKGEVLISPSNTQIVIETNYHDNSEVVDGSAKVTINTAGLFDLQTSGEVLAKVDYNGHAWVSWNPLDVGVDVHAWYSSWLEGDIYAHLWKGQGWQNKYWWLPNDSATHFAGSIKASIDIDAGQAFSWQFIEIPPWDITFSITVAFGQFCKGSGCSGNEWGIKGKFEVIGYDIGFFYGFKTGFHFILGSDGHVLLDQYAAAAQKPEPVEASTTGPMSAGIPLPLVRQTVADPLAPLVLYPLNVTAFTGSFIAGLTWSQGAPVLTLIRPDGKEISPANAASYSVSVIPGVASILYGVKNPMPGTWQAKIQNTAAENDYHLVWFANKAVPAVNLLTPSGIIQQPANNTTYNLQWSVPTSIPTGLDLRLSLYYTVTNSTALTETQTLGGVIRENLPLSSGSYNWDLSSLAYGDYQVYARLYSGQPGNEPILPTPTLTGTNQIPGDRWIEAPGILQLTDQLAPSPPVNSGLVPIQEGFRFCWAHNTEKDLAGYVVRYYAPDVEENYLEHYLRVHAEVSQPNTGMQCARLGRFNEGEQIMAQVAAYDASGNLSAYTDLDEGVAFKDVREDAPDPEILSVEMVATNQVNLSWAPADLPDGSGAWLYWSRGVPPGIGQTEAPVEMGRTDSYQLTGLQPGWVYFFFVQYHDDWARLSEPSNVVAVLVSDFIDWDRDMLPDDWEAAHAASDPGLDPDGDGLDNLAELSLWTHPQRRDTDGDGFSDGEELVGGSDPLDPNFAPGFLVNYENGLLPLPELVVDPLRLAFRAYVEGEDPAPQVVNVSDPYHGELQVEIVDDAPWLSTDLVGTDLSAIVQKSRLPAGHYTAVITISGPLGTYTQNSPQTILVDLWLLQGSPPGSSHLLYLPVLLKR